jgi:hypothetical protein
MDDTKYFTFQVKGQAYKLRAIHPDSAKMIATLRLMGASDERVTRAMFRVLERCSEAAQWDQLTDRLVAGEVSLEDFVSLFKRLAERQAKETEPIADAE